MASSPFRYECRDCGARSFERTMWCGACLAFLSVSPIFERPLDAAIKSAPMRPASQLYRELGTWARLPVWLKAIVGKLPRYLPYLAVVSGPPGVGKTRLVLRWADFLSTDGRVCFFAVEEGAGASIGERLRELEIISDTLMIGSVVSVEDLRDEAAGALAIFIDSATWLQLQGGDLSRLMQELQLPVIATLHVRKDGAPAGHNSILHAADVVVHLPTRDRFEVRKNRFSPVGEGVLSES